MNDRSVEKELALLVALAREASKVVMQVYATDFTVEMKGHDDPVTRADKEANHLICERLAAAFPEHGILAEESAPSTDEERARIAAKHRVFFVDPVDGTREFADKNGEFCVMIGLAEEGCAVAGIVAVPVENKLLWGSVHDGTWIEPLDGSGPATRLDIAGRTERVRAVVSRSHPAPRTTAILQHVGVTETIPCGSVGLKAARVVEGRAELYVHASRGASLWDACAPEALVRGAGGIMTTLAGTDIDYRAELKIKEGLLATRLPLISRVLEAIRSSEPA